MIGRVLEKRLVPPKATLMLYRKQATIGEMLYAKELMDLYMRREYRYYPAGEGWEYAKALGFLFEAGRIQGIREERLRKKRKITPNSQKMSIK